MQNTLFHPRPAWLVAALQALATYRFLTVAQLAALVDVPATEVVPVVEALAVDGVLVALDPTRQVTESEGVPAYALTRAGARQLALVSESARVDVPDRRKSLLMLGHDLARNTFGVVLHVLSRRGRLPLLRFETARARIADAAHVLVRGRVVRVPLVADAYAVLGPADHPTALLVEVDRGTVSAKRMRQKFLGYYRWWYEHGPSRRFGLQSLRVVTLANTTARMQRLRVIAREATEGRAPGLFWFGTEAMVSLDAPETFLMPTWTTAGDDAPRALIDAGSTNEADG